ncbi:hypothetical protein NX794_26375 [Streptomyces sp. LP11]|uniref:Extensin n=1 Tax=Streptomyces pyxinicus TaxID=2970331 RepID=A0ABT2B882_9ACTN|nr:hypothetical protein [Streptomyces sp. LP11]MCS0604716.1 hypothetical protein [Streptomyces sp. LP11]
MADEQYRWLNRDTAERLLRGESLEAVDAPARDQAERLSGALGALSAQAAPATGELPGEEGALAAFRKAREEAEAERAGAAFARGAYGTGSATPAPGADAGLVRIGARGRTGISARRPRWARPARLVLAAAVAAGTLGGVAVAAGSGVLPTPFHDAHPGPTASVTAGITGEPLGSASPQGVPGTAPGTPGTAVPGGGSAEALVPDERPSAGATIGTGDPSAPSAGGRPGIASACRDIRDGKGLETGRLRALEDLAGGSARVTRYCKVVLAAPGGLSDPARGGGGGDAKAGGKGDPKGGGRGRGDGRGKGGQGGDGPGGDGPGGDGPGGDGPGGDDDSRPGRHPGKHRGGHGDDRDGRQHGGRPARHRGIDPAPRDPGRPGRIAATGAPASPSAPVAEAAVHRPLTCGFPAVEKAVEKSVGEV